MEILLNSKFIADRQASRTKLREVQWLGFALPEVAEPPPGRCIATPKARSPILGLLRRFGKNRPIAALALILVGGTAHSLDFKGIALGSIPTAVQREMSLGLGQLTPCALRMGHPMSCRGDTQVAGLPVSTWVSFDSAGRVEQIVLNFQPAFYEQIEQLAQAKYGVPEWAGRQRMANSFGLAVEVIEEDWSERSTGDTASLLNYAAELDNGQLTLRSGSAQ